MFFHPYTGTTNYPTEKKGVNCHDKTSVSKIFCSEEILIGQLEGPASQDDAAKLTRGVPHLSGDGQNERPQFIGFGNKVWDVWFF